MKQWFFNKLAMVTLMTGVVIALAAGAVFAAPGEERAKIDLIATSDAPGATGEAGLRIRGGEFEFEAKVEGLTAGWIVSFCLDTILIDTENVEGQGRVELDEDDPADLSAGVPGSISGLMLTIRRGESCAGRALLEGMVS